MAQAVTAARPAKQYELRPMPNEEIHVFIKKIDNTRVVREHDPKVNVSAIKTLALAVSTALAVIALIVPIANSYLAGYTVTDLEKQNAALEAKLMRLASRESQLTSVEALAKASRNQLFLDPTPESMVVLEERREGDVALIRNKQ